MTAHPDNVRSVQEALVQIGWPLALDGDYGSVTHQAVADFQKGWTPTNLVVDGWAGPVTCDALNFCVAVGGHCSPHFTYREFKSKGNGWIRVNRTLVRALEKYRAVLEPGGLSITSGYRDPTYNRKVGGATNSQHLYGSASDLQARHRPDEVRKLGVFSGIGIVRATGLVLHVDVRGQDGAPATTPGTRAAPTIWFYA